MRRKTAAQTWVLITQTIVLLIGSRLTIAQQQPAVPRASTASVQGSPHQTAVPNSKATSPVAGVKRANGTITGFVYWQINVLQPKTDCQGLTVKVITVNKSGLPLQLLDSSSTLTAMGPVTDASAPNTPTYMLCSYAFQNMPENIALRTLVYGVSSSNVSLPAAFQIPGGSCNSTPSSALSFILSGGEVLCGNGAFNINFKLAGVPPQPTKGTVPLLSDAGKSGGMLSNSSSTSSVTGSSPASNSPGLASQTSAPGSLSAGTQTPLLSSPPSNGPPSRETGVSQASTVISGASSPANPHAFVPKMPPMSSNAKRDASPQADAEQRGQIQAKTKAQVGALRLQNKSTSIPAAKLSQSDVSELQALQQQITFANSLRTQGATTDGRLITAKQPTQVRVQPPQTVNPLAKAVPTHFCPAPQVHTINGKNAGVVFTQDPAYNDYIISGCGFGTQAGQIYLSGAITGGRINLAAKAGQWSDTRIEASVQPGLTGVLDGWPDLIVAPVAAPLAKFPNTRFYAQRQSVLLPSIPRQYATLANVPVGNGKQGSGTEYCPGPDLTNLFPCIAYNAGLKLDGFTNGVDHRNDSNSYPVSNAVDRDGDQQQFDPGQDTYDLSYMAPGFEIDQAETFWYDWPYDVCESWASDAFPKKFGDSVGADVQGYYNTQVKTKTKIVVDWAVPHCGWRWLGVFRVDDWYNSGYSLQVYVKGPIGVDPWTGHSVNPVQPFEKVQPTKIVRVH